MPWRPSRVPVSPVDQAAYGSPPLLLGRNSVSPNRQMVTIMQTAQIIPFRFESREVGPSHSAIFRSRIIVISSRTLGEMLDCHNETYTFLRATGAVEHRAGDGVLLAISINGKHYMDRLIDPVPVRPGAVSTSRRRVEALPRTIRHKEGTKKTLLRRRAPMSIRATKPDQRICGDERTVTSER